MLLNLSLIKSFPVEIEIPRRGDENKRHKAISFLFIVEIEILRRGDENCPLYTVVSKSHSRNRDTL